MKINAIFSETNTWTKASGQISDGVNHPGSLSYANKIFLFGGYKPSNGFSSTVMELDWASGSPTWSVLPDELLAVAPGPSVVLFNKPQ